MKIIDSRNRQSPSNLRKKPINDIKFKMYVLFRVKGKNNGRVTTETILGNSSFEMFNNRVDYERALNNAKFNMYWIAVQRGFNSDVNIINIDRYGFSQSQNVTIKRVKRKGKYYNYTYVKGVRGVVSVSKWTNPSTNNSNEVIDELENEEFTRNL